MDIMNAMAIQQVTSSGSSISYYKKYYLWSTLLEDATAYGKMSKAVNPYGDGLACGRIVDALR